MVRARPVVVCLVVLSGLAVSGVVGLAQRTGSLQGASTAAPGYPAPVQGDYVLKNVAFAGGERLPELRLHYRTIGQPRKDGAGVVRNAVLVLHGTTGSGAQFLAQSFAGELFGAGQLLDATKYFLVLVDNIGHGGSSRPSDGLRAKFPKYGYRDMVTAQYRLLTEGLGVNHLRLVIGTSMGGMHSWLWGEMYPDFMDALMPLASLPTQISGRNRMWRRIAIDAIRSDPEWQDGNYSAQPRGLRTAAAMLNFMSSNPVMHQAAAPTLEAADQAFDAYVNNYLKTADANNVMYALQASWDYDPGPALEKIKVPLVAVNSADDLINPPELGILEREIRRVASGRAFVIPLSDKTRGHGSHTIAALWKNYLADLLAATEK
ncbi:MAG: alpha/beta fold hydrolase [Acidobacteria bacterium]|nr:alpha/beta fold hydrolase [Acidobacteriota bacterium]